MSGQVGHTNGRNLEIDLEVGEWTRRYLPAGWWPFLAVREIELRGALVLKARDGEIILSEGAAGSQRRMCVYTPSAVFFFFFFLSTYYLCLFQLGPSQTSRGKKLPSGSACENRVEHNTANFVPTSTNNFRKSAGRRAGKCI